MNDDRELTPDQRQIVAVWEEHMRCEFETRDADATMETMTDGAYVNHVPVLTGGVGTDEIRNFYARRFIPQMPPDTSISPISRTIGADQIVDEQIFRFTHSIEMDWMLPGVAPTNRPVEIPLVVIVGVRNGKVVKEHIYWDQASVLVQLGLISADTLPVSGAEQARKVEDPRTEASNRLIDRRSI